MEFLNERVPWIIIGFVLGVIYMAIAFRRERRMCEEKKEKREATVAASAPVATPPRQAKEAPVGSEIDLKA